MLNMTLELGGAFSRPLEWFDIRIISHQ